MRILVCGGRDFGGPNGEQAVFIFDTLNTITELTSMNYNPYDNWLPTDITIITGGACGADTTAYHFAISHHCKREVYPAEWDKYGKKAGYLRNVQMLEEGKPDIVVAFPGGRGTDMMKRLARDAGIGIIDMGTKGSSDMTVAYSATDLKIMLNEAILTGDQKKKEAISDMLVAEYEETMKGEDIIRDLET